MSEIQTRIGPLDFTHPFENGYPTPETLEKLFDERDFQRACQAYLWALPIVSFAEMQRAAAEDLGAGNGQLVAYLSYTDRLGILTPNATTPYYIAFADLSASGPLVIEVPPDGVRGGLVNLWQGSIAPCAPNGRYLVLGPGQPEPAAADGFETLHSPNLSFMIGIRITAADPAEAQQVLSQLRVYPWAERDDPPPTGHGAAFRPAASAIGSGSTR